MPPTHLLLLDIDETLLSVDEGKAFVTAFRERLGITPHLDWERYQSTTDWGVAVEILEEHLGHEPAEVEIRGVLNHFVQHLRENIEKSLTPVTPTPGSVDFLRRSAEAGIALGLATGCVELSARLKLEVMGVSDLFPVGGFGDLRFDRESLIRDGIAAAEAHHGVRFPLDHICVFGDRAWDFEGAEAIGTHFIGVATNDKTRQKLTDAGATRIIADFGEITEPMTCFESPAEG